MNDDEGFDWRGNFRELMQNFVAKLFVLCCAVAAFGALQVESPSLQWDAAPAAPAHSSTESPSSGRETP